MVNKVSPKDLNRTRAGGKESLYLDLVWGHIFEIELTEFPAKHRLPVE